VSRAPAAALFPAWPLRQQIDDYLTRALAQAQERVAAGPVTPTLDVEALRSELHAFDFTVPRPLRELLDWSVHVLERGITHLTHPRYFGLFNPAPSFPAQCADRIAGSFNPQVASSATSPAAVAIEAHLIRMVAQRAGFPAQAGGHFTSGGSEANYTALLCALTRAHPQFASDGARAFGGRPVFYSSRNATAAGSRSRTRQGSDAPRRGWWRPMAAAGSRRRRSRARSRRTSPAGACRC